MSDKHKDDKPKVERRGGRRKNGLKSIQGGGNARRLIREGAKDAGNVRPEDERDILDEIL